LKTQTIIILVLLCIAGISCDNKTEVIDSKKEINREVKEIEEKKSEYEEELDSLNKDIITLSKNKFSKRADFAEAEIYNILKNSYLDHIIIGSNNIDQSKLFFQDKLGFSVKEGLKHNNGISSFFIEFEDSSEIEFMSLLRTDDQLAKEYKSLLENEKYGFSFAVRTNQILKLTNHFKTLSSGFTEFNENKDYSTLSKIDVDPEIPLFFIQHHQNIFNTKTNNLNNTNGISAVWLSTNDIKKSAKQFIDFGFSIIDTISVGNLQSKMVLIRNNNFEIILIDSDRYEISGLTIITSNLDNVRNMIKDKLNLNLKERNSKRGKSVFIDPTTTNSIWFEFLEKTN